jgi:hypothetical protein
MDWCCLCKKSGESIDHLFIHCEVASEMWNVCFQLFGVVWVMPCRVSELLGCWREQLGNRGVLHLWRLVPCPLTKKYNTLSHARLTINKGRNISSLQTSGRHFTYSPFPLINFFIS